VSSVFLKKTAGRSSGPALPLAFNLLMYFFDHSSKLAQVSPILTDEPDDTGKGSKML